ncbi:MAG: [FeFe] hydrogenase H-cluster radical SAM maturase HydE [Bacteroidales bacterium]|jgi:biotin synthase|nr:[FeFe] hydrogenase H-cluster radical SAM maturase HydE [Bacteroidales bacterium]
MIKKISNILNQSNFSKDDLIILLKSEGEAKTLLFKKAAEIKKQFVSNKVYYRGLVEFSNICNKNCLYCGIRKDNKNIERYNISDDKILEAMKFSYDNKYGSAVLQSGEIESPGFTNRVSKLLKEIKALSNNELGVTISLGEQTEDTYKEWFENGAHRYLLRIESSNKELYYKIHPKDENHNFEKRIECLKSLQKIGYQTGTGVMIGLPFQTYDDLAKDLIFMKNFDIDMVGMGPYIEQSDTPLYKHKDKLLPLQERFDLTLKMIAILRIMMKDINIAAATALQAIDKIGREKAIKVGANIIMPNVTPGMYRDSYALYENKPCTDENADDCSNCLEIRIGMTGDDIGYSEWGDSKHYFNRINTK